MTIARMLRSTKAVWICVVSAIGAASVAAAQDGQRAVVDGKVVSIGYPFSSFVIHAVREANWFPILVELQTPEPQLTVDLRVTCNDLDGDSILYTREALTIGVSDGLRRFWCYAVTRQEGGLGSARQRPESVEVVLTGTGVELARFDIPDFEFAGSPDELILDISAKAVTRLQEIQSTEDLGEKGYGSRIHYRKHYIARGKPADTIPDQWFGLEPIDVVVWDLADPRSRQIGLNQLNALLRWVERGGHLIVGIGQQADVLRDSELADILPVDLTGGSRITQEFPQFDLVHMVPALRGPLDAPVSVANATLKPGAMAIIQERGRPLIAMHSVGSGRVTASTAPLNALLRAGTNRTALTSILDLNQLTDGYRESETESLVFAMGRLVEEFMAQDVHAGVSFARRGGLLALLATLFVASYIALSTLVSWVWLKRLDRLGLSWPIFGLFAIAASFLSMGTVRVSRGLTSSVQQVSLVDMDAGSREAASACWFGYRAPNRESPDFSLPTVVDERQLLTENYLRPLSPQEFNNYATPASYIARVGFAELRDVLIRSTVKQFEGFWSGSLDGTIQARLFADVETGRIRGNSFLVNALPVDIAAGAILYLDPRVPGQPLKAAGLTETHRSVFRPNGVPPAANVLVVPLRELDAGDELRGNVGADFYRLLDSARERSMRNEDEKAWVDLETLRQIQYVSWRRVGWSDAQRAMANLSFHHMELPGGRFTDFDSAAARRSTKGLVDYDISHWLVRGQAVILLAVNDPGPAVLYRDGVPRQASGQTLYRIRVPLEYVE